jgi:RNA polymerase sigma-70 factor (ECF subfamily)
MSDSPITPGATPADSARTSPTLLGRLRLCPTDQAAWSEFVDRYAPVIFRWCRHWGLQEADAEDVTQNVLLDLGRQMRRFSYNAGGRFRSWLRTVAHRTWCDFLEGGRRQAKVTGDSGVLDLLSSVAAGESLVDQLEAECQREQLSVAMARVQARVEAHTWEAFRLTALEGLSGAEAGQRLSLAVGSVFQAKSRIQRLLQAEVQSLDEGDPT